MSFFTVCLTVQVLCHTSMIGLCATDCASLRASCYCLIPCSDQAQEPAAEAPNMPAFKEAGAAVKYLGQNIWLDTNPKNRRVLVRAKVCRQEAALEEFMCLLHTKEHESILTADIVPRVLHAALLATGAERGSVAKFDPEFRPPTGDKLEITVEWKQGDKFRRVRAQDWVRDARTMKPIAYDFVFAGSQEAKNPLTGELVYFGDDGDLISVANFTTSVIDLATRSSTNDSERGFEAFTERIPPVDTEVVVILRPQKELSRTGKVAPVNKEKNPG